MSHNWCADVEAGAVLLTVNQRLSRHYLRQYSDQQLQANRTWWETPSILPLSAWLKQVHAEAVAKGSSGNILLADIAAERAWQQTVAQDEAASNLLDTDLAAANAQKAWRVANAWGLTGVSLNDPMASDDQQAFARWRAAYVKHCKRHQVIDNSTIATHITELIATQTIQLPEKVLLAGFLSIPVQIQQLLDALREQGVTVVNLLPTNEKPATPVPTANMHRVIHVDDDAAFTLIAREVRRSIEDNPNQHVGVVVHDLQQRRSQVLRAFDSIFFPALNPHEINAVGRPYDLSIGLPLNEQSVVRTALLFLTLLVKGLDDTELSAFLLSPYLPGSDKDARARERLDRQCRDNRIRRVGFFEFIALLPKGDALRSPLQKVAKKKWEKQSGAAVWAEHFGAALRALGWPGKSIDSEEYQTVEAWNSCLDDFQVLDDGESMNDVRALRLLVRLCRSRVFQLETAATPIQIMGRLESHGLDFDKLWVTGMDSDQWPPIAVPTSFLPILQQQDAGVPDSSPTLRLALAIDELELWKRSTSELYLCHAQTRDGLELSPASIIDTGACLPIELDATELNAVAQSDTAGQIMRSISVQLIDDTHGPELAEGTKVKGGTRLLENQARCPFKAFALHRLGIKKLEEAGLGLDPRQHGNLFHHCIELFWKQVGSHTALTAMPSDELHKLYTSVIEQSMKEYSIEPKLQGIQSRHLYRLLSEWVNEVELKRQPFTVTEVEQELDITIAGVNISVKVDRVDTLATGQTVVIDYKTGQHNTIKSWGEPRIENPQLPLYVGTNEDVEGVCFAQVFPNKYTLIGTTSEDNIVSNLKSPQNHSSLKNSLNSWDEARVHWSESLNMLATEIRHGCATITPVKKACEYCELPTLCRIDKNLIDLETEEESSDTAGSEL